MIKKVFVFLPVILIMILTSCKKDDDVIVPSYEYDGEPLHTLWPYPVGAAVPGAITDNGKGKDNALLPGNPQYNLLKHFNVVVAENEMKPENIMPSSEVGGYKWDYADALVEFAEENGKRIRGHVLIWHAQTPSWFFPSSGTGEERKAKLYANMEKHIKTVFEHFGGKIDTWDVCNEVVDQNSTSGGGARADSNYTKIMEDSGLTGIDRYEYVVKAFQWARQYADANGGENVKLYLTDFGIERRFPGQSVSKIDMFEQLVDYLIEKEAPIDGVGFQGHFRLYDHPVDQISDSIDKFSAKTRNGKNLMVQVCELDFSIYSNAKNEGDKTSISGSTLVQRLSDLAENYRAYFNMFEEKFNAGKLDMVVIWGISDRNSWLNNHPVKGRTDYPLLFDRNYKPKKAFISLTEGR